MLPVDNAHHGHAQVIKENLQCTDNLFGHFYIVQGFVAPILAYDLPGYASYPSQIGMKVFFELTQCYNLASYIHKSLQKRIKNLAFAQK